MSYEYYILPAAREEYRLAREWYNQQNARGLGFRFAQSVKDCINRIQANPLEFAVRYRNVRIAHTAKFPYALHFYPEEKRIVITAIIFQGRNPFVAMRRVE